MRKIRILRSLNQKLKYQPILEYEDTEVIVDIAKDKEELLNDFKQLIETNLKVNIKSIKENFVKKTIAKYGLIDLSFEVDKKEWYLHNNGLQILRENAWIDKEIDEEFREEGLNFLQDLLDEMKQNKCYLKVFARSALERDWIKEKYYLLSQMMRGEKITPRPEDQLQLFKIKDICFCNCSSIWLHKYFYL
ncbi:MAG: hypothetical protein AAF806_32035 [Bacteroidota bacterium]